MPVSVEDHVFPVIAGNKENETKLVMKQRKLIAESETIT